jgi:O-antigen/teichoic acid export membrane protein
MPPAEIDIEFWFVIMALGVTAGKRLREWFQDGFFQSLFRNVGVLWGGDAVARLLLFVSTVLTARALGAEQFGTLVLVQTYAKILGTVVNFQSWQAVIKFGAEALAQRRQEDLKGIIRIGCLLDIISALLGTASALCVVHWVGQWVGWSEEVTRMAGFYSLVILLNGTGTPVGIIRLFDRFRLFATQRFLTGCLKLTGVALAYYCGAGLWEYAVIWMVADALAYALLLVFGYYLLHQEGIRKWWRHPIREWRPFFAFACWTNLASTVDIPVQMLDVFIVSSLASLEAVGVYKIFKQVSDVLTKPVDPVYQVIYPQFASMIAAAQEIRAVKMALKVGILILLFAIPTVAIISLSSPWWLGFVFGPTFASQWVVFDVFLCFQGMSVVFTSIHPLFLAMGYVKKDFSIAIISNVAFLFLAWYLGRQLGLMGIVIALGIQSGTVIFLKLYFVYKKVHKTFCLS